MRDDMTETYTAESSSGRWWPGGVIPARIPALVAVDKRLSRSGWRSIQSTCRHSDCVGTAGGRISKEPPTPRAEEGEWNRASLPPGTQVTLDPQAGRDTGGYRLVRAGVERRVEFVALCGPQSVDRAVLFCWRNPGPKVSDALRTAEIHRCVVSSAAWRYRAAIVAAPYVLAKTRDRVQLCWQPCQ